MSFSALFETHLHSLPLLARGKVRDNFAVGEIGRASCRERVYSSV